MTDDAKDEGGAGSDADNLLDAAAQAAAKGAGKTDAEKAADRVSADAAAAAAAKGNGLAFSYDEKGAEQVFGKAGADGRPANVPEKYWDPAKKALKADVVFGQLKWAEGKLGKPLEILGAPAEGSNYEIKLPAEFDGVVEVDAEDPRVLALFEVARESDLNQGFVSKLIERAAAKVRAASDATISEEIGKLGANGQQRIKDLGDFLGANLTAEQTASVKSLLTSAPAFEAVEALISKAAPPKFASKEDQAAASNQQANSKQEWETLYFAKNENGERLMAIDPEYRKRVDALRDKAFGTTRRDADGRAVAA
jgi:hypothetical protein